MTMSRHHLLFEKANWNATEPGRKLRITPSLIPRIDRDVHTELHDNTASIPVLGHSAMLGVLMRFHPTGDTLKDMDYFALALDRATKTPRAHQSERDIAGIAIEEFLSQKQYVIEGMLRA